MDPDWIAIDWGTSNLRVWAIAASGAILARAGSDEGMARLSPDGFEPALLRLIGGWLGTRPLPALACGMVGARQGWTEAAYRAIPCAPLDPAALTRAPTRDPRLDLRIAPGLSQDRPADVMRGEETQIAGALMLEPGFDGVVCLPGTHSKWAHVSAGEVVSFQTHMTGELFELVSRQSVLRHSLGADDAPHREEAFLAAVSDAISRPERIGSRLFGIRAEGLLHGLAPATARARLSGLLIGMELAAARPYWLGQPVALIGSSGLARAYATALAAQGAQTRSLDATACTLAGLTSLLATGTRP
ncbi:2-dehydro-3-deoxygalactonokinase [Pseudogemmobacter sonorensis]|uniref:2-dehydro-3-deoxygalactonokinase n=1 Tax=Pseudogemmobacter sonorensis TaxID=2989681 RepID=UPI003682FA9B